MIGNYCTHAIDDLSRIAKANRLDSVSQQNLMTMIGVLKNGVKFALPDYGIIYDELSPDIQRPRKVSKFEFDSWHLPYPATCFEFASPEAEWNRDHNKKHTSTRRIVTLTQGPVGQSMLHGIWYCDDLRMWLPSECGLSIELIPESFNALYSPVLLLWQDRLPPTTEAVLEDYQTEICAVIQALSFMRCNNVYVNSIMPPRKLNEARAKKGKPPFFEYKVLELKKQEATIYRSGNHSDRASPRIHLRRGHIRRLPNGESTFVSPCVVGDKSMGMIAKDYVTGSVIHADSRASAAIPN